jgi:hypothetical protein
MPSLPRCHVSKAGHLRAPLVSAPRNVLGTVPINQELELQILKPGVNEDLTELGERVDFEQVAQVFVPDAKTPQPHPRRMSAAVAPAERAPLRPTSKRIRQPGRGPVGPEDIFDRLLASS